MAPCVVGPGIESLLRSVSAHGEKAPSAAQPESLDQDARPTKLQHADQGPAT